MRKSNLALKAPPETYDAWRWPDPISIPDWVEQNIRLTRAMGAAEPGPLRISRTPYIRGPLQAMDSPFIEHIVIVWGRQLSKSTGVQYSYLCYSIAQDPGPAVFLLPIEEKAKLISKEKIQPMMNACEAVVAQKTGEKDDFTTLKMKFRNMLLTMGWAGSESQTTSRSVKYLFIDEMDEIKKAIGANLIDPIKGVRQTMTTFPDRKEIDTSTPSIPEGNIWQELTTCQRVLEYWVDCPHCGVSQLLYWENVKFGSDPDPIVVEETAYYECEACKEAISNLEKIRMLAKGEWRARTTPNSVEQIMKEVRADIEQTISLDDVLKNRRIKKIGFHLPKWYSPFSGGAFGVIAKERLEADKQYKETGEKSALRNWTVYNAARPWIDDEFKIDENVLLKKREQFGPKIPAVIYEVDTGALDADQKPIVHRRFYGALVITAGIDVQDDRLECEIVAWGLREESWSVDFRIFMGSPGYHAVWDDLDTLLQQEWETELGDQLRIKCSCIDTGGHFTKNVYDFIRPRQPRRVYAIKGADEIGSGVVSRPTKVAGDIQLFRVGTDAAKEAIYARLQKQIPEKGAISPGYMHFPMHYEEEYFRQLTAERAIIEKNKHGFPVRRWEKMRARNEALDCRVYAMAALAILRPNFDVLTKRLLEDHPIKDESEPETPPEEEPLRKEPRGINKHTNRPRGGWMGGYRK